MTETVGIVMNGVTGRMGSRQHLARSVIAIRDSGGVKLDDGRTIVPDPILVGRSESKLRALAELHGIKRWSTDLNACLENPSDAIYFDAQTTARRVESVQAAIAAGKHIYCEKPVATDMLTAKELAALARAAGVKTGVVADKLFLPGFIKLKKVLDSGLFGRIISIRGEFGYWVFEGDWRQAQRPSWNYRAEEGGGIIVDMFGHWHYLLEELFGPVRAVSCTAATHVPDRVDEQGAPYRATAEDSAYALFEVGDGIIARIDSSWCFRVYRDDLFVLQVDGTHGSAVAGLRSCKVQHRSHTPSPVWDPDAHVTPDYRGDWQEVPDDPDGPDNAFRYQWEQFIRHVVADEDFPWDLAAGARAVQLAALGTQSWRERRWVDVPGLDVEA